MVRCSFWQWARYLKKVELVQSYNEHSTSVAIQLSDSQIVKESFDTLWNQKISVSGTYDFENQVIVTNKKHATGSGHFLITPLKIDGSDKAILVSRGFIPFEDRDPATWGKYDTTSRENLHGVLKHAILPYFLGPSNPEVSSSGPLKRLWYFEEIDKMAKQLPYPIVQTAYIQRLGKPPVGEYPAQAVSIEVPPSTHFGYTIEWALLAIVTVIIGFWLQAYPRKYGKRFPANEMAEISP